MQQIICPNIIVEAPGIGLIYRHGPSIRSYAYVAIHIRLSRRADFLPFAVIPDELGKRHSFTGLRNEESCIRNVKDCPFDLPLILDIRKDGRCVPRQCESLHIESLDEQSLSTGEKQVS